MVERVSPGRVVRPNSRGLEGKKMSVSKIAPLALPTKVNEAAVSYSAWLNARGIEFSPAQVQAHWDFETEWRTSPERVAERAAKRSKGEEAKLVREWLKAEKVYLKDLAQREEILAAAKRLGIVPSDVVRDAPSA
jgi:hypothetical protein